MANEAIEAIDKQIVAWVEELDDLSRERTKVDSRIQEIQRSLSAAKAARRALAEEWKVESEGVSIPLAYTGEGVQDTIHEVFRLFRTKESLSLDQIIRVLINKGYDFGDKNPRRVVNMALVNDPQVEILPDGEYKYSGAKT
jgi:uncharacterized coiled-coil DUF342 family protein